MKGIKFYFKAGHLAFFCLITTSLCMLGGLVLLFNLNYFLQITQAGKSSVTVIIITAVFLSMMLFGAYLIRALMRLRTRLTQGMQRIIYETDGLQYRLEMTSYDDVNEVIATFNAMATTLNNVQKQLEELMACKIRELNNMDQSVKDNMDKLNNAKKEAELANKIKSEFLVNIGHELRTPLNAIIGYGELLQEDLKQRGHQAYLMDLEKILTSTHHLILLVDGALDLSKDRRVVSLPV